MGEQIASTLLDVFNLKHRSARKADLAFVAALSARFRIKGRLGKHEFGSLTLSKRVAGLALANDRNQGRRAARSVIPAKIGRSARIAQSEPGLACPLFAGSLPAFLRARALLRHRRLKTRLINGQPARAQNVLSEIERETIGVVKTKRRLAGKHSSGRQSADCIIEELQTTTESALEACLLLLENALDRSLRSRQLWISLPHLLDQRTHKPMHRRFTRAQHVTVAHRPAHDPSKHIPSSFVRRHHAISHQEGGRTKMVCNYAEGSELVSLRASRIDLLLRCDQRLEQINLVIVMYALQDG